MLRTILRALRPSSRTRTVCTRPTLAEARQAARSHLARTGAPVRVLSTRDGFAVEVVA